MKVRRSRIVLALITIGGIGLASFLTTRAGAAGEIKSYASTLSGSNEVGAGDPDGTGTATATTNSSTNEFCWDIKPTGIGTITAAHLHTGAAGANGPVTINFNAAMNGCTVVDAATITAIATAPQGFYLNVHTNEFAGGAIRGQLAAAPPANSQLYLSVLKTPVRAYDSRQAPATKLASAETRVISLVQGKDAAGGTFPAVPVGSVAAEVVITVTQTSGGGFVSAHAAGTPVPGTSTVNWFLPNSDVATSAIVAVDATGRMAVTTGPSSGTHVIVDVVGYYYALTPT